MSYYRADSQHMAKEFKLEELGCPDPSSTDCYSFTMANTECMEEQPCVGLFTTLKKGSKYEAIQHFTLDFECPEATMVLCCRRQPRGSFIITKHKLGKCPLTNYHTEEAYDEYIMNHFGEDVMHSRQAVRRRNDGTL